MNYPANTVMMQMQTLKNPGDANYSGIEAWLATTAHMMSPDRPHPDPAVTFQSRMANMGDMDWEPIEDWRID